MGVKARGPILKEEKKMPTPPIEIKKQWKTQRLPGMQRGHVKQLTADGEKDGIDTYVMFKCGKVGYQYHHFIRIRNDFAYSYSEISRCDRALKMVALPNKNLIVKKKYLHSAVSIHNANKKKLANKNDAVCVHFCMV